jgi:hypothetical protein
MSHLAQFNPSQLDTIEQQAVPEFAGGTLGDVVSALLLYIIPFAGLAMLLYLLYGGYQYLLSRGDPKAMQQAQGAITTALIGFILVFAAYWIVQIIGRVLGIVDFRAIFR